MSEPPTDPESESPESSAADSDTLVAALERHRIELPADQIEQLENYTRLLWAFNQHLNLTRHTDFEKFVSRDLIDSLELAATLEPGEEVLDVGTGGGVPGVILAICRPDVAVSLCESVGKRASVVDQIIQQLELPVPVYHGRVEDVLEDFRFDSLVARAVGSLAKMLGWVQPHWAMFRRLLLVKGPRWVEERGEARHRGLMADVELRRISTYPMPGTDNESVILQVTRKLPPHP